MTTIKPLALLLLLSGCLGIAAAQTAAESKPAAKPVAKAGTKAAPKPATPREELKSEALGLALAIETTEAINESQLEIASRVLTGSAECEYDQRVEVSPVAEKPGLFKVRFKEVSYYMSPEETTTGAVRLFDKRSSVVWLQIPVKSMLLNTGTGKRLVDRCTHAEQRAAVAAVEGAAKSAAVAPTAKQQ